LHPVRPPRPAPFGKRAGNTVKYIKMAASSNFGNVFSILVASAWLPFQPMRPIQLLTQNLLYDLSQVAIPFDTMDPGGAPAPRRAVQFCKRNRSWLGRAGHSHGGLLGGKDATAAGIAAWWGWQGQGA
jgi:hypothetical protein